MARSVPRSRKGTSTRIGSDGTLPRKRRELLGRAEAELAAAKSGNDVYAVVVRAVVPLVAEFSMVDAYDDVGVLHRPQMLHADPYKQHFIKDSQQRYPTSPRSPVYDVLRTGQAIFIQRVEPELLERIAADSADLAILRKFGPTSYVSAPLVHGGRIVGVHTSAMTSSGRSFTEVDFTFARQLAAAASARLDALDRQVRQSDVVPSSRRSEVEPRARSRIPKRRP